MFITVSEVMNMKTIKMTPNIGAGDFQLLGHPFFTQMVYDVFDLCEKQINTQELARVWGKALVRHVGVVCHPQIFHIGYLSQRIRDETK